jgi:hypothetical protein
VVLEAQKMAGKHEVEVLISEDGDLKVTVKGMKGQGCLKVAEGLIDGMGAVKSKTLTTEYYEKPQTTNLPTTKVVK